MPPENWAKAKSTVPPEKWAPLKSTVAAENSAPSKPTVPPENRAKAKLTGAAGELGAARSPPSKTTPVKSKSRPCQDTAAPL